MEEENVKTLRGGERRERGGGKNGNKKVGKIQGKWDPMLLKEKKGHRRGSCFSKKRTDQHRRKERARRKFDGSSE